MNQPLGTNVAIALNPSERSHPGVPDGVVDGAADGVAGGGVGVGLADATGLAVGVALGQDPSTTETVSMRQPGAVTLLSDPIRKRSLMVCPATFGPKFATVLK